MCCPSPPTGWGGAGLPGEPRAYSLVSLAAAFAPNLGVLLALRFLAGPGLGAEPVLADTCLAEFLPRRVRGRQISWAYTIGFVGVPIAALPSAPRSPRATAGSDGPAAAPGR